MSPPKEIIFYYKKICVDSNERTNITHSWETHSLINERNLRLVSHIVVYTTWFVFSLFYANNLLRYFLYCSIHVTPIWQRPFEIKFEWVFVQATRIKSNMKGVWLLQTLCHTFNMQITFRYSIMARRSVDHYNHQLKTQNAFEQIKMLEKIVHVKSSLCRCQLAINMSNLILYRFYSLIS